MTKLIGTYGHGTHNDFVLVADLENQLDIKADQVKRICDRRSGIGADGFIRVTKESGKWFMDYRNADGSIAEMCGSESGTETSRRRRRLWVIESSS